MIPYSKEAYQLLHEGSIALAKVEANGIRVDTKYLDKAMRRTRRKIKRIKQKLNDSEVVVVWKKTFRGKVNLNSNVQLGKVLFDVMGFDPPGLTATGLFKTDEASLATVDHPFVEDFLKKKKLEKALGTYLKGVAREVCDGFIHPVFNLHLAQTFRSSCDSPNFQNIPIRNPEIGKLIRTAFVARPGHVLVEIDYSGIEVAVAACYHQDPRMLNYIEDKSTDMHRDMAMECYQLSLKEVTKEIRYCGKNMFVFPQFYGDWYIDCAKSLWNAMHSMNLKTATGLTLKEHLRKKGIRELGDLDPKQRPRPGTFEQHIMKVEKKFWGKRFPVYSKWKKRWYEDYKKRGWFLTKTGFICQGFMKRNEAINYPVQGSAFHCLLWSLTQMVNHELQRRKMKALMVGQIHDSTLGDVPEEELDDYLGLSHDVMIRKLKEAWDWIVTPLEIEAEVTPVGGNWAEKEKVEINV